MFVADQARLSTPEKKCVVKIHLKWVIKKFHTQKKPPVWIYVRFLKNVSELHHSCINCSELHAVNVYSFACNIHSEIRAIWVGRMVKVWYPIGNMVYFFLCCRTIKQALDRRAPDGRTNTLRADSHHASCFCFVTVASSFRQNGLCSHCPSCSVPFQNSIWQEACNYFNQICSPIHFLKDN
jgi:hypothetical protein